MTVSKLRGLTVNLERATDFLERALEQPENEFQRAAVIQGFEFTFELAWKLLQERLRAEGVLSATPRATFRSAGDAGLVASVERWLSYLNARNLTSHTYHEATAAQVYAVISGGFLGDARALLA